MSLIPEEYQCPITMDLMTNAVIDNQGVSYDETAIRQWLTTHSTSPTSRLPLRPEDLRPNLALRARIDAFRARLAAGGSGPSASVAPMKATTASTATASTAFKGVSDIRVAATRHDTTVHLTLTVPEEKKVEQPMDVLFLEDVSGSMGASTEVKTSDGTVHISRTYMSVHCARVMAKMLGPSSRVGFITYSESAKLVLPPTPMDAAGIRLLDTQLKTVEPDGRTNIFAALRMAALQCVPGHRTVCILLTDGLPTPEFTPGRGGLLAAVKSIGPAPYTLHTIGFGNELDSSILQSLCEWGNGRFYHAPSMNEIGATVTNMIAAERVVASIGVNIEATLSNGTTVMIPSGTLGYGQERMVSIPDATKIAMNGTDIPIQAILEPFQVARYTLMRLIETGLAIYKGREMSHGRQPKCAEIRTSLEGCHDALASQAHPRVKSLMLDIRSRDPAQGQLVMASDHMNTWGEPYLRAYMCGLTHCLPFNDLDPGLLDFVGSAMNTAKEEGERALLDVEAFPLRPAEAVAVQDPYVAAAASARAAAAATQYVYGGGGGCFINTTQVRMADGTLRDIAYLRRGDMVATPTGPARVIHNVRIASYDPTQKLTALGTEEPWITPWHPVRIEGRWRNPIDLAVTVDAPVQVVYNLVLEAGHIIFANGFECVTLGHGFQEEGVAHEFFGTGRVLEALKRQPGYNDGIPCYTNLVAVKDTIHGPIINWIDMP